MHGSPVPDRAKSARALARALFATIRDLPIVSPHGHTEPRWYAENQRFPDPAQLLIVPDHYVFRMLFSQGIRARGPGRRTDRRRGGRDRRPQDLAAVRRELLPVPRHPDPHVARPHLRDPVRHHRAADRKPMPTRSMTTSPSCLQRDEFRPRALFERFNLEVIATTDAATDELNWHKMIRESAGRAASSPPIAPTRWSIRTSPALRQNLDHARRAHRRAIPASGPAISTRTASAAPSSRSTAPPRPITATPPPTTADLNPERSRRSCSTRCAPARPMAREGAVPRPDAHRDGPDERSMTGWCCRSIPAPGATTRRRCSPSSAATRASISRAAPTMSAR